MMIMMMDEDGDRVNFCSFGWLIMIYPQQNGFFVNCLSRFPTTQLGISCTVYMENL